MDSPSKAPSGANVSPTLGSVVGAVAGLIVAGKIGLNPVTPEGGATVSGIAGVITALFHWIGSKTGIPGLG